MKNYTKIPFSEIKNIESYVEKVLKAGYIIIQILVDEDNQQIAEMVSFANDKECKSYYRNLADSDEQLRTCVITETLEPYYAFKDKKRNERVCCCDIDIEKDCQDITDFASVVNNFASMEKKYYSGESFKEDDLPMHYEFYISMYEGDIANFVGSMEIDFVTEWMTEQGYYSKQM